MILAGDILLAILESITGSYIYETKKKQLNRDKLKSIAYEIQNNVFDEFKNKYESELYYNDLDSSMVSNRIIQELISYSFNRNKELSKNKYIELETNKFIEQYPEYKCFRGRIAEALTFLAKRIEDSIADSGCLDYVNLTVSEIKNDTTELIEKVATIEVEIRKISASVKNYEKQTLKTISSNKYENTFKELNALESQSSIETQKEIISNLDGIKLYAEGNYQEAIVKFEEAVKLNPDNIDALYNLASSKYDFITCDNVYIPEHDDSRAIAIANKLLDPLEDIKKAYELDSTDIEVKNMYAYLLMATSTDIELAYKLFEECTSLSEDKIYKINLSICCLVMKKYSQALEIAEELELEKFDSIKEATNIFALLGNIYSSSGIFEIGKAIRALDIAAALSHDEHFYMYIDKLYEGGYLGSIYLNNIAINIVTNEEVY